MTSSVESDVRGSFSLQCFCKFTFVVIVVVIIFFGLCNSISVLIFFRLCNSNSVLISDIVIFTALHVMQTRYSQENSVCPSVCLSVRPSDTRVIPDKTEERSVQIFIPYERTFTLFSEKKNGWWGRPLLPEILGQLTPVGVKSLIFNQ